MRHPNSFARTATFQLSMLPSFPCVLLSPPSPHCHSPSSTFLLFLLLHPLFIFLCRCANQAMSIRLSSRGPSLPFPGHCSRWPQVGSSRGLPSPALPRHLSSAASAPRLVTHGAVVAFFAAWGRPPHAPQVLHPVPTILRQRWTVSNASSPRRQPQRLIWSWPGPLRPCHYLHGPTVHPRPRRRFAFATASSTPAVYGGSCPRTRGGVLRSCGDQRGTVRHLGWQLLTQSPSRPELPQPRRPVSAHVGGTALSVEEERRGCEAAAVRSWTRRYSEALSMPVLPDTLSQRQGASSAFSFPFAQSIAIRSARDVTWEFALADFIYL